MNMEEWKAVEVGQKVYFYRKVYIEDLSTFSAVIKSKIVDNANTKYYNFSGSHYVTKHDALRQKIIDMRTMIVGMKLITEHDINFLNYKGPTTKDLKTKFNKIMSQKNVKPVIEKYPETFI